MDVYEIVNNRIIELLEAGCCPWLKPWNGVANTPRNLITKREYSGVNLWLLNAMNYSSPYFASYRQITERGGNVKKGSKANIVVFWKLMDKRQSDDPDAIPNAAGKVPLLRYYNVFNVGAQTEGIEVPQTEETQNIFSPIEEAERIIQDMPERPIIRHMGNRAYYSVGSDTITLPPQHTCAPGMARVAQATYDQLWWLIIDLEVQVLYGPRWWEPLAGVTVNRAPSISPLIFPLCCPVVDKLTGGQ